MSPLPRNQTHCNVVLHVQRVSETGGQEGPTTTNYSLPGCGHSCASGEMEAIASGRLSLQLRQKVSKASETGEAVAPPGLSE